MKTHNENHNKFCRTLLRTAIIIATLAIMNACAQKNDNLDSERKNLINLASKIEQEFSRIREEANNLAATVVGIYADKERLLAESDKSLYALSPKGVLYKPIDDNGSAVFVSGYVPVNDEIKDTVSFTAAMDQKLKQIVTENTGIVQAYYNDKNSYNRIYPYFDVLNQYEPGMNIPSFNFYYLADEQHNPERKAVWVDEPYVDPAGRGWMVSAIAPVYVDDKLEGVAGIDVTANSVAKRFLSDSDNLLLLDKDSTVISGDEKTIILLEMPPLVDHQYTSTVTANTYRKEDYSLLHSKSKIIRQAAQQIFKENTKEVPIVLNNKTFTIITEPIPELKWTALKLVQ